MLQVENLFLAKRETPHSSRELFGDMLLTPARIIFEGRRFYVLKDSAVWTTENDSSDPLWLKVLHKIVAFVLLPFSLLGALIKLTCLGNLEYRVYRDCVLHCFTKRLRCTSKQFEMVQQLFDFANHCRKQEAFGTYEFMPLRLRGWGSPNYCMQREIGKLAESIAGLTRDKTQLLRILDRKKEGTIPSFLLLEYLAIERFLNISIDIVDADIDPSEITRINQFFAQNAGLSYQVNYYKNIDALACNQEEKLYDATLE
jgi:hypothetical protein